MVGYEGLWWVMRVMRRFMRMLWWVMRGYEEL